ncbi:hypothetical protein D1007_37191 [Hordeum vulgare]|nr:hypothetical protein D1007_37191 [Hordeum vulgare]
MNPYLQIRLADVHGCFQEAVVALKQDVAEALAAVHRRDRRAWFRPCGAAQGRKGACTPRRRGQRVCQPSLAPEHRRRWPRQRDGGGGDGLLMESATTRASASAALCGISGALSLRPRLEG